MKQQQLISIIIRLIKLSETKGSGFFCFSFNKRSPEENWVFCIRYFWRTKSKSTKTITEQCFSCQNKSVCQKSAQSCRKWKSAKNWYTATLFVHEGLQLLRIIYQPLLQKDFFSDTSFCLVGYVNDQQKIHRVYKTFFFSMLVDKENWGTGHKVHEGVGQKNWISCRQGLSGPPFLINTKNVAHL